MKTRRVGPRKKSKHAVSRKAKKYSEGEYKYFYSLDTRCNISKKASMVKIYPKNTPDNKIINETAKSVGIIMFTYKDFDDKCDMMPKTDKLRLLTNNIVLNNKNTVKYNVTYFLNDDRFQYKKGSVHKASIENKTGIFNKYNHISVRTKNNGIRVVKLTR